MLVEDHIETSHPKSENSFLEHVLKRDLRAVWLMNIQICAATLKGKSCGSFSDVLSVVDNKLPFREYISTANKIQLLFFFRTFT